MGAELIKHKGCQDCWKNCLFNAKIATPEIAMQSKNIKFRCNSTYGKIKVDIDEIIEGIQII